MLEKTLLALSNWLDEHLRAQFELDGEAVALGPLVDEAGRPAASARLAITLVHLEREAVPGSRTRARALPGRDRVAAQPLYLNVYILLSADPRIRYDEGLKLLAGAMRFLQTRARVTPSEMPQLPAGLDELSIEPYDVDFERANDLWSMLGANHRPGILYRLRGLPIQDSATKPMAPPIEHIELEGVE